MGIKKRKYSKEQKEEIVKRALSSERALALGKEHNISPGLTNRRKGQLGFKLQMQHLTLV